MKTGKRFAAMLLATMMLLSGTALAGSLSLTGTVEAGVTIPVYAPIGGTVESVNVQKGVRIGAGEALLTYRTEKVYAAEDGTVTGVFVQPGDDAETVSEKYGANLYIEGTSKYTVSASTSRAYSSVDSTFVHAGEKVYLRCNADRTGEGVITAVDGSSYTVLVTEGDFITGDSVAIFRDSGYTEKLRVGRGSIARISPTAVTATGAVVNVAVKDGDQVKRGDLLMETLSGTFEGYVMTGLTVQAAEEGVITSVSAEVGAAVTQGDVIAQIAPVSGMRVEAAISADDRKLLKAGDKVTIELEVDETRTYAGIVRYITEIPEEDTEEVTYKAIIDFTPDEHVVFGMTVAVTAGEEEPEEDAEEAEEDEKAEAPEAPEAPEDAEAPAEPGRFPWPDAQPEG